MAEDIIAELKAFIAASPSEEQLKTWMSALSSEQYVECAMYLFRSGPTTFVRVLRTEYAYSNATSLTDEDLFSKLAQALADTTELTPDGKIGVVDPKQDPEPSSRFASLINEAVRRGFQRDDIGFGMRPYLAEDAKLSAFGDPEWKAFEKLVARIHIAFCRGADVRWSEKLIDNSGTARQLDVTIRTKAGPHEVLGIVQCKYERRPVAITDVESFILVKQDLNAGFAVMVSRSGYQEGALAKAKLHDVRLWTLEEASCASWRDEIRTFELRYHMFEEIQFNPRIPADAFPQRQYVVEFGDVTISNGVKSMTLSQALEQAIKDATERCLPLPCWLDVNYEEGSTITLHGQTFPIQKLELHFTHKIGIAQQKLVKIPLGSAYIFKKTDGLALSISERDLPPLPE